MAEDEHLDIVPNFSLQGLHLLGGTVRHPLCILLFPFGFLNHVTDPPLLNILKPRSTVLSAHRCEPAYRCGWRCF